MTEPREIFFDAIEYQQRIDKVREEMVKAGVDLLIMTNPTHVSRIAYGGNTVSSVATV